MTSSGPDQGAVLEDVGHQYLCIDLKSFYASVECVERGLDPMQTRLVVADGSRTDRTICLAISPALKALGVRNRCRLFEVPPTLDFIVAPPRMQLYIDYSARIYSIYLSFFAKEDIHVYSVDESFIDVTPYLSLYRMSARELGEAVRSKVTRLTGIPATCGLGTNLYLAKVALDISAKHRSDFFGELNQSSFRATLWDHRPLTDFWRIGHGTAARLARIGVDTMAGIAFTDPGLLYHLFGIDAEILIDHAWGREPCTMADIKAYRPRAHSLSTAQVFGESYRAGDAVLVAREMAQELAFDLTRQQLLASKVILAVGYRSAEDMGSDVRSLMHMRQTTERRATAPSLVWTHALCQLPRHTASASQICQAVNSCFWQQVGKDALVHRLALSFDGLVAQGSARHQRLLLEGAGNAREQRRQHTINNIKDQFGRNAVLRAADLLPQAKARERNSQIGGHRSGDEQVPSRPPHARGHETARKTHAQR